MHDRRVPDHRRRSLYAAGSQALLQCRGAGTRLPRAITAKGDEVAHFPPLVENDLHPCSHRRRQRPQDGHGQFGDGLFKAGKVFARPFSFRTTRDVEHSGGFKLFREAVATAIGRQDDDVKQRMQVPTRAFPSF